jgi:prepilin-type N-terminal cleavage/methylation domain-containing protein
MSRRRGFTLIELLVVIAIIAILAGMLFPVFARARESARKIQCLSNVKNIAMAVQMYLVDYGRFWSSGKQDAQAQQLITDLCGGCGVDCRSATWNPYQRVPVLLDEYIKNRDVWRCPSAKVDASSGGNGFAVNPCTPDWYTAATRDGCRVNGCDCFPPGWGGTLTDSMVQGMCSGAVEGAFTQSISNPCVLRDRTPESSHDVAKLVVCGDAGQSMESVHGADYAFPDIKFPTWLLCPDDSCTGHTNRGTCDDDNCGDWEHASKCTVVSTCFGGDGKLARDPSYRKTFARHLGGDNLGFADGHAQWMPADQILLGGHDHTRNGIHPQLIYGLCICTNLTATPRSELPEWKDDTAGIW